MIQIPAFPNIPEGDDEVRKLFGDIRKFIRSDGTLSDQWEQKYITRITLPSPVPYAYGNIKIKQITVHRKIEELAVALYNAVWRENLVDALGPYGGGFVYRPNANNKSDISLHSYGIAWDWNPKEFPNKSNKKRDPYLVRLFNDFGFLWGENFKGNKDPMHCQFALGT